jgi:RNA polymerase sigma factor (sigma-70 family)
MLGPQTAPGPSAHRAYDLELLRRFRMEGDEQSFTELFSRRAPELTRKAKRSLKDEGDVMDVVHETFIALRSDFDAIGNASIRTWLYRVLTFKLIDRLRRNNCLPELLALKLEYEDDGVYGASEDTAIEEWAANQTVDQILRHLPVQHREIVLFREIQDWTVGELCTYYGKSAKVVQKRVERARESLRLLWRQHPEFFRGLE